jgi:predicted enzyme related to lactoylglutathione lyase
MTTTTAKAPSTNVVNWFEIPVSDIARATALYSAMLDTKLERSSFGGVPHAVI